MFSKSRTCIIIRDHAIRYIHASKPNLNSIQQFGERYLPPGIIREGKILDKDFLSVILDECLSNWKVNRRNVFYTVPDQSIVIRPEQIPGQIPEHEIRDYVNLAIGSEIQLPFEEPAFDFVVKQQEEMDSNDRHIESKSILLVGAPKQAVDELKNVLEGSNLKPKVADLSSLSVYRLLYELNLVDDEEHVMSIRYNLLSVNVSIFHKHQPAFVRHIASNIDYEQWELQQSDRIDQHTIHWPEEYNVISNEIQSTITEIERIMNFYTFSVRQGQGGVTKIMITGDHPFFDDIIRDFKEAFGIPIETIDPSKIKNQSGEEVPCSYYDAVGLSLKKEV